MEYKISELYSNHENEIKQLSLENLSYLHNYFKHEFLFQQRFVHQSSLECIQDRKKISTIYKRLNLEIKKRYLCH
ncbi:hypothetical protein [Silvanigrella aquatica]|uniref:50S ribosomal protein L29 n=1 Tax=Silvanigrella aquatica TaxID=1915309 RepID=A0A1L4D056_9BACT|nr:hypothetical protein [Silvanigrella aquatica]APJ03592.1 hypothetical protein AXG55_06600 [Silvanigrella aquatica]